MINWIETPLPYGNPLLTADLPNGRWHVRERMDGPGQNRANIYAEIKFTPHMPEGEDVISILRKTKEAHGDEAWNNEAAYWHRYISGTEMGYANSAAEAELLIKMLSEGDDGSKTADDVLLSAGYTMRHTFSNWRGDFRFYDHPNPRLKKLNVVISTDGVYATYDGANGLYNIMRITGDHLNDHITNELIKVWWPEGVNDYRRIGAEFILRIVELRRYRGGLFRVPLLPDDMPE